VVVIRTLGMFLRGCGISSARWLTQSGVPTAKAAFNIPARNTKPSLLQPVVFCHSAHTVELVAYPLPVLLGMIAQTRVVTSMPPMMITSG